MWKYKNEWLRSIGLGLGPVAAPYIFFAHIQISSYSNFVFLIFIPFLWWYAYQYQEATQQGFVQE